MKKLLLILLVLVASLSVGGTTVKRGPGSSSGGSGATIEADCSVATGVQDDQCVEPSPGGAGYWVCNSASCPGSGWTRVDDTAGVGGIANVADDLTPQLGADLDGQGFNLDEMGVVNLIEQADADADVAGRGQIWVNTAVPNELWFTNDAGTDVELGSGDASNLGTGTIPAARVGAAHIDLLTEIAAGLKSGADATLITGTSTNGQCAEFNVDGDIVGAGAACGSGGGLSNVVEDTTPQIGGTAGLDMQGQDVTSGGVVFLTEQADAEADVAGQGQIWVNTAVPNELWFTDDAGTDVQLGAAGAHAGTITWTGTSILESGAAFQFGDGTDATLTHTYANTGTDVTVAYSTGAVDITGALTADSVTVDASAAPQLLLVDSTTNGEVAITVSDGAGPDGVADIQVDEAGTLATYIQIDGINTVVDMLKPTIFGDSVEITSGAAPTTNATGEIALDTTITDHQPLWQYFDGGENMTVIAIDTSQLPAVDNEIVKYNAATDKFVLEADATAGATLIGECNITIESATTADDIMCGKATSALTITSLDCTADGGTANIVVEVEECDATGDTCVGSGFTVTVNDLISNFNDSAGTDAAIDDGDWWRLATTTVTSAPTYLHCQVEFTR